MRYSKKEFYRNFYNNHFLRDFLFIKSNKTLKYDTDSPRLANNNIRTTKFNLNFLVKYTNINRFNHGALVSQISYYKSFQSFKNKSKDDRYANCLFFDFDADIKGSELNKLKDKISYVYENYADEKFISMIKDIQKDYREILFTSDVLSKPFNDAKKLYIFFKEHGINTYTVFSGSKGVHLYLFFDECKIKNISDVSLTLAESYKSALNLSTLDLAVNKDAISRKSRVIYGEHEASGLFTTPFDITSDSISDVLESARKQHIMEFDLNDYSISDKAFINTLKEKDKIISAKKIEKEKLEKISKKINNVADVTGVYTGSGKDDLFKDMRVLVRLIAGDRYVKSFDKYDLYHCILPDHEDKTPSARVYKKNYLCESCNLSINYFDLIRRFYNLTPDDDSAESKKISDDAVKDKMKELKKLVKKNNEKK